MPAEWRDESLAEKWKKIRTVRKVVTGALEIERREKRIGSSLEAAPAVYLGREYDTVFNGLDADEIFITSNARVEVDQVATLGMDHPAISGKDPSTYFTDEAVGKSVVVVFHQAGSWVCKNAPVRGGLRQMSDPIRRSRMSPLAMPWRCANWATLLKGLFTG